MLICIVTLITPSPHMSVRRKWNYFACSSTSNSTKRSLCAMKDPICSKMDNKCPFPNSLPFSANHWMATHHFVSHFANSADNGSYLWLRKLFSINYCISHKASPLPPLTPPYQMTTAKHCKWSRLIFTYPPPTLHHFIITVLVCSVLSGPTEVAVSSRWLLY